MAERDKQEIMDHLERLEVARHGVPRPAGSRPVVAAATGPVGGVLRISGQIAASGGQLMAIGTVGKDIDLALARACARQCAINLLDAAYSELNGIAAISSVARLRVYVASVPTFTEQHLVADAATDLLHEVLGIMPHARTALGVTALPRNSPVEVDADLIVQVDQYRPAAIDMRAPTS